MKNKYHFAISIMTLTMVMLLINIDSSAVNLALAPIAKTFSANLSAIQWIVNSYLLTAITFMIVSGWIGDRQNSH